MLRACSGGRYSVAREYLLASAREWIAAQTGINNVASSVSAQTLLGGAWYALEQAGRLLDSAVTLFEAGDWSTAIGISMFGSEELGRSRILRGLAQQVLDGESVSPADVWEACDNHVAKQRAGVSHTTMRTDRGTRLDDQLRTLMHEPPNSEAWRSADRELRLAVDAKTKRMPHDQNRLRERSFYVDIDPSGGRWTRPREFSREQALNLITDVVNAYAIERDRLRDEVIESDEPDMERARRAMDPRPELVSPRWPSAG